MLFRLLSVLKTVMGVSPLVPTHKCWQVLFLFLNVLMMGYLLELSQ